MGGWVLRQPVEGQGWHPVPCTHNVTMKGRPYLIGIIIIRVFLLGLLCAVATGDRCKVQRLLRKGLGWGGVGVGGKEVQTTRFDALFAPSTAHKDPT